MPRLELKFTKNCRGVFRARQKISFEFDPPNPNPLIVVGENGCGKTTFVDAVRVHQCNNRDEPENPLDGRSLNYGLLGSGGSLDAATTLWTDFTDIFVLGSEFDNPQSHRNAYDASAYVHNHGYATQDFSHGQVSSYMFTHLFQTSLAVTQGGLLILDEADNGLDIPTQTVFFGGILKDLARRFSILCFTHSLVALRFCDEVFDFKEKRFVKSSEYERRALILPEKQAGNGGPENV